MVCTVRLISLTCFFFPPAKALSIFGDYMDILHYEPMPAISRISEKDMPDSNQSRQHQASYTEPPPSDLGVGELVEHGGRCGGEPEALGHLRGPSQGQTLRLRQVRHNHF